MIEKSRAKRKAMTKFSSYYYFNPLPHRLYKIEKSKVLNTFENIMKIDPLPKSKCSIF